MINAGDNVAIRIGGRDFTGRVLLIRHGNPVEITAEMEDGRHVVAKMEAMPDQSAECTITVQRAGPLAHDLLEEAIEECTNSIGGEYTEIVAAAMRGAYLIGIKKAAQDAGKGDTQ